MQTHQAYLAQESLQCMVRVYCLPCKESNHLRHTCLPYLTLPYLSVNGISECSNLSLSTFTSKKEPLCTYNLLNLILLNAEFLQFKKKSYNWSLHDQVEVIKNWQWLKLLFRKIMRWSRNHTLHEEHSNIINSRYWF